jgi:hypothetical protein
VAGNIVYFQKDHGIVYPVLHIRILQVEADAFRAEIGHIAAQDAFAETQVAVETARQFKILCADEGPDRSCFMLHKNGLKKTVKVYALLLVSTLAEDIKNRLTEPGRDNQCRKKSRPGGGTLQFLALYWFFRKSVTGNATFLGCSSYRFNLILDCKYFFFDGVVVGVDPAGMGHLLIQFRELFNKLALRQVLVIVGHAVMYYKKL